MIFGRIRDIEATLLDYEARLNWQNACIHDLEDRLKELEKPTISKMTTEKREEDRVTTDKVMSEWLNGASR